jgi:AcrR family transcriptional regulator
MNHVSHSTRAGAPRGKNARGLRTRAALLRAAEELFGVRGYEGTSIVDLTRHAKIALGTFYVHFEDKKELFCELVDSLGSRLRRHLAEHVAGAPTRIDMERRGLEAFLDFVAEHRHMYRIVRQADFVDQACFRRYYRRMAEGYAAGLAAAADKGEIRAGDPEVFCWCLMGISDFLGMRWVLWEKDKDQRARKKIVADALSFIEAALAPPAPPPAARRPRSKR